LVYDGRIKELSYSLSGITAEKICSRAALFGIPMVVNNIFNIRYKIKFRT